MDIFVIILTILVYIIFFKIILSIRKGKITKKDIIELKESDELGIFRLLSLSLLIPYVNVIALIIIVCYVIIALIILGVTLTKEKLNNWLFENETNS